MSNENLALIVGLNRYPFLTNLYGPQNDAEAFYKWLISVPGGELKSKNIGKITSARYSEFPDRPDFNDIWEIVNRHCCIRRNRGSLAERFYIFLAGHGFITSKDSQATNCLLPANARPEFTGPHFPAETFATRLIQKGICKSVCLFYDGCRVSGHSVQPQAVECPNGEDFDEADLDDIFVLYACKSGAKSREAIDPYDQECRGYFTSSLLMGLKERTALINKQTWDFPNTSYETHPHLTDPICKVTSDSLFEFVQQRVSLISSNQTVKSPKRPNPPFVLSSPPVSEFMNIYAWNKNNHTINLLDSNSNQHSPTRTMSTDGFTIQGWTVPRNMYALSVNGRDLELPARVSDANIIEIFV